MDIFTRFNRKSIDDRQIDTLIGISKGIVADGKIDQSEAEFVMSWLVQSRQASDNPIICNLLDKVGDDFARVPPQSSARRAIDATIECIGCAVCYASCDVVGWNPAYLGPAALNRAFTLVKDVRDGDGARRLRAVAGDAGCLACHTHQSCTERCPKHLSPTASIASLKRLVSMAALKGEL